MALSFLIEQEPTSHFYQLTQWASSRYENNNNNNDIQLQQLDYTNPVLLQRVGLWLLAACRKKRGLIVISTVVVGGCGWLWVVVGGCGWLWVVVGGCGWLWVVVGGCGWL
jgi:hypothetical protein